MKNIVGALIVKKIGEEYFIMTQLRKVLNKAYDPFYDNTWETMGETVEEGESVIDALIRGCREEFGLPDFKPKKIVGINGEWTTGRGDRYLHCEPFCFIQSLGPPQPWVGPFFIVEVPEDFKPNYEIADGESTTCKWWRPADLENAIKEFPQNFMGFHAPALYKLCLVVMKKGLE